MIPNTHEDLDKGVLAYLLLQDMADASSQGRTFTQQSVNKVLAMRGETNLSQAGGVGNINISDDGEAIDS